MSMHRIGGFVGLALAFAAGAAAPALANERPQDRAEQAEMAAPADTTRPRVLGRPADGERRARVKVIRGERMRQRGARGHGMMGRGMRGPSAMLRHREALALSPEQIQRLEVITAMQRRALQELGPQAMRVRADLMAASTGEIDLDAAREAHERLARIHGEMMIVRLRAVKEARETLTPGQLTRWDAMSGMRSGRPEWQERRREGPPRHRRGQGPDAGEP